jgi:acyl-CoA synthetase (AMP-forming)/AMP-acid ligase II
MENPAAQDKAINFVAMIFRHAEINGDSCAILTPKALITYRGLEALTSIVAARLVAADVKRGDVVVTIYAFFMGDPPKP